MVNFDKIREIATINIDSLYPPDKRRKGIVCPLCGNGQGKDGDGVNFVKKGSPILKCFRCNFSGDVILLTAKARNITYYEAAEILSEKLGINSEKQIHDSKFSVESFAVPKFEHVKNDILEEKVDQTEYFKKIEKYLPNTDYPARRGFSQETCRHFHLGYDAIWKHPKVIKAPVSPRLIIPTGKYSYLARDVRENLSETQKRYSKQKFGAVSLFNIEALDYEYAFITEGEIDAMSFYEVSRVNALALGSVSNIQKLADYLKTAAKKPKYVIAALDNDQAGREGNLKLKQALKEIGIHSLIADFIYTDSCENVEYKDANEILVKNREAFIENIELIWKISPEDYETDKPASQIVKERELVPPDWNMPNEVQKEFEPYSDEELSKMIIEPAFTEENFRAMFGNIESMKKSM